ncbi:hypothetical protein BJ742DRAFT_362901 [Cladochytrium replicatum]|nr:hypothetical protein BJ742DRAFT_362901 [Cladochytrium replicatum]
MLSTNEGETFTRDAIHNELDEAYASLLALTEFYLTDHTRLTAHLKTAYLDFAHCKYVLGPSRLVQSQYDKRMRATVTVRYDPESGAFRRESGETVGVAEDTESTTNTVRRRRKQNVNGAVNEADDGDDDDRNLGNESGNSTGRGDPLTWFGILVPPRLRTAQTYFKAGLEDMIRLANYRVQMDELLLKIEDLKRRLGEAEA